MLVSKYGYDVLAKRSYVLNPIRRIDLYIYIVLTIRSPYGVSISEYAVSALKTERLNFVIRVLISLILQIWLFYLEIGGTSTLGLIDLMAKGLSSRMLIKHMDAQGQGVFTSRAWRRLFEIRGLLAYILLMRLSWLDSMHTGPRVRDKSPTRRSECLLGRDLDRKGFSSVAGRSQAPKTVTDLFYLRGIDIGLVNAPYLLDRYLRMFASGKKNGAMISGGTEPPHPAAVPTKTIAQRLAMVEEDVHEILGALGEQR
nr:hypothetical protein [Tanacetum cinerariifolium]